MSDYRSKPDPDNPWRYVCPECGKQVYRGKNNLYFYCHGCPAGGFSKADLYDKKTDNRLTQ